MPVRNGYAAYQNNKVMTASPGELTLMLYEGMIKFTNIAIIGVEEHDIQKAHNNIIKTDFNNIYVYLKERLVQANFKKDKAILEECLEHERTLRDTWKEVMRLSKSNPSGSTAVS